MSTTWTTLPITKALAKVLDLISPGSVARKCPESEKNFFVVSYCEDFDFLWDFYRIERSPNTERWGDEQSTGVRGETALATNPDKRSLDHGDLISWIRCESGDGPQGRKIVVVFDGVPGPNVVSNINLASFVTPFDWAVALTLMLWEQKKSSADTRIPIPQVIIVDLTTTGDTASGSAQLFRQFQHGPQPLMSQAQCYGLATEYECERAIKDLLPRLLTTISEESVARQYESPALKDWFRMALRQVWAARLLAPADPRDRHALANLVSLQVLLSTISHEFAVSSGTISPCLPALVTLMRAVELSPEREHLRDPIRAPWISRSRLDEFTEKRHPTFVLLDDLHELGWADFLRLVIGLDKTSGRLIATADPDASKFGPRGDQRLLELLQDESGRLRVNQGIELCPGAEDAILFLDLRLFNMRTVGEEMEFFRSLLKLAEQVRDDKGNLTHLPWRGFTSHELQSVADCIFRRSVESENYFVALTMLPRLLALVDPKLPIILFSSTGQRRVMEALKGYDSIITEFSKPRFWIEANGYVLGETRDCFDRAFTRALGLLRGRRTCSWLKTSFSAIRREAHASYVEIYLDESGAPGDPTFRVGGVSLLYENKEAAERFNREMLNRSLVWGPTEIDPAPRGYTIPKEKISWDEYQTRVFEPVEKLLQTASRQQALAFCLVCPPGIPWQNANELTSPWCMDNLYRALVLQSLEVLLYETIPECLGGATPSFDCAVYVATRARAQSDVDSPVDWPQLVNRYGIRMLRFENGEGFVSVGADSVYPMVAQVLSLNQPGNFKIVAARGGKLRYGIGGQSLYENELPRPAHFLADLAVRFANNPKALTRQPTLQMWLSRGFLTTASERFDCLLNSCRQARAGRHLDAVLGACKSGQVETGKIELDRWARQRISQSVDAMSGRDFAEFCRQLSKQLN